VAVPGSAGVTGCRDAVAARVVRDRSSLLDVLFALLVFCVVGRRMPAARALSIAVVASAFVCTCCVPLAVRSLDWILVAGDAADLVVRGGFMIRLGGIGVHYLLMGCLLTVLLSTAANKATSQHGGEQGHITGPAPAAPSDPARAAEAAAPDRLQRHAALPRVIQPIQSGSLEDQLVRGFQCGPLAPRAVFRVADSLGRVPGPVSGRFSQETGRSRVAPQVTILGSRERTVTRSRSLSERATHPRRRRRDAATRAG
jgi:hypothetical protein